MRITEKQIEVIINTIKEGYDPVQIWLFGSYALNRQKDDSDIDLLIVKDTNIKSFKRASDVHKLFDPYIYDLDIFIYTPIEFENLKDKINTLVYFVNQKGKLIYERVA